MIKRVYRPTGADRSVLNCKFRPHRYAPLQIVGPMAMETAVTPLTGADCVSY